MGATYCKALFYGSNEYDLSNVKVAVESVGKF